MNIIEIINKKREKKSLTYDEISYAINGYMKDEIQDYQMSSLLMAICINSMNAEEIYSLTDIMIKSGNTLDLSMLNTITVDKHSTGGVGDKTTLIVGPIVASCGVCFPKMSGRGLGHTGGTIDKLESIKGFKVDLTKEEFINNLKMSNISIISQTENIATADKKIYALRDSSGTTNSIGLIASSIMSKKIACGADKILLDVKYGIGAFVKTKEEAIELSKTMINIGKRFKKETIALITNMDNPLGNKIGNSLEIEEVIEILKLQGNKELRDLCITMSSYIVSMAKNINFQEAQKLVIENLNNMNAYNKFLEMVKNQKGQIDKIPTSKNIKEVISEKSGYINSINALEIANYALELGAGRINKTDTINYSAGIELLKNVGDYVEKNDCVAKIYYDEKLPEKDILNYYKITDEKLEKQKLILGIMK